MNPASRKQVARAALSGVEAVTAGHGVGMTHPERRALKEGFKVLDGADPSETPMNSQMFWSIGPDPVFHKATPARFKSADHRFQAQVARVRTLDKQSKAARAWHVQHQAPKKPSLVELYCSDIHQKSGKVADLSVDVDFQCMRMSSAAYGPGAASKGFVDEGGYLRPLRKIASSSKFFRVLEE